MVKGVVVSLIVTFANAMPSPPRRIRQSECPLGALRDHASTAVRPVAVSLSSVDVIT
jgi:hypothetical protein